MGGHRDGRLATLVQAPAQLSGEEEIGQFRRAVVRPRRADPQTGDIVEVDVTDAVHDGAHRHHPRAAGDQESLEDQSGEGEVPQVIGGHLELETVWGLPVRRPHHPGVVDEEIEPGVADQEPLGRQFDGDQIREIERQELERGVVEIALQFVHRPTRLLRVATRQDDMGTPIGEHARRLEPDSTVGARDERHLSRLVTDLVGAPRLMTACASRP